MIDEPPPRIDWQADLEIRRLKLLIAWNKLGVDMLSGPWFRRLTPELETRIETLTQELQQRLELTNNESHRD